MDQERNGLSELESIFNRIVLPTAKELVDLYEEFNVHSHKALRCGVAKRLIAPPYRYAKNNLNLKGRPGEPELKQLFIHKLIENTDYKYSVETQTSVPHNNTGKNNSQGNNSHGRSGNIDLTIYDPESTKGVLLNFINVEFKAIGASFDAVRVDIKKLMMEKSCGIWFLSLINANKGTMPKVLQKLSRAFNEAYGLCLENPETCKYIKNKLIMIFVAVLGKKRAGHLKIFDFREAEADFKSYCDNFFNNFEFHDLNKK